jgi:hypothetical protein
MLEIAAVEPLEGRGMRGERGIHRTSTSDVFDRLVAQNRAESVDLTRPTSIPSKNGPPTRCRCRMYSSHEYPAGQTIVPTG